MADRAWASASESARHQESSPAPTMKHGGSIPGATALSRLTRGSSNKSLLPETYVLNCSCSPGNDLVRSAVASSRYVGAQARASLDAFFQTADCREILVVDGRQLLPRAALRNNIAGGIPDRQLTENLTVVFADHRSYLPAFRKTSTSAKATKAIVVARRATMAVTDEISLFAAIKVSNFLLPTNAKVTHPQLGDCRPTFSCGGFSWPCAPCGRSAPYRSRTRPACGLV